MQVVAERYELGETLGVGGMARVVRGHDTVLDRPVAVKLLGEAPDEASRRRFLREAQASARLRHPAAVAVYDTGEADGQSYIVMELVEGRSLADLLRERGPLDVEEAVAITASVLEALTAAHTAGLIHRDVKPANVLLPDAGGVKLSDFGIAKALDDTTEGLTATGSVLGTPSYLAPELVDGANAGPASDLYSAGCLLYAQLTGHPPFRGAPLAVAYAHRHHPVPPLTEERPDVPDDLARVVARALEKAPEDRFPDATAMRAALLGTPIEEADPTTVVGAGAAGAGAAGADAAGAGWLARQEHRQGQAQPEPTEVLARTPEAADDSPQVQRPVGTSARSAANARPRRGRTVALVLGIVLALALIGWAVAGWLGDTGDPEVPAGEQDPADPSEGSTDPEDPQDDEDPPPDDAGDQDDQEPEPNAPAEDDPAVDGTPEDTTPDDTTPDDGTPPDGTPDGTPPDGTPPDGTPNGTLPDGTPDDTTPDDTTPNGTLPDGTPDDTPPDDGTPNDTPPDDGAGDTTDPGPDEQAEPPPPSAAVTPPRT